MGNYGAKIAKPGYNINATSLDKYNFHSTYPLLKIKRIDTGSGTSNSGSESLIAQIAHNLGYAPMFDLVFTFTGQTSWYPASFYSNYPGLGALEYMKAYTDSTYLYIYFYQNDQGTVTVNYKSVIYYDPVNP